MPARRNHCVRPCTVRRRRSPGLSRCALAKASLIRISSCAPGASMRPVRRCTRLRRGWPSSGSDCISACTGSAKPGTSILANETMRVSVSATPGRSAICRSTALGARLRCAHTCAKRCWAYSMSRVVRSESSVDCDITSMAMPAAITSAMASACPRISHKSRSALRVRADTGMPGLFLQRLTIAGWPPAGEWRCAAHARSGRLASTARGWPCGRCRRCG